MIIISLKLPRNYLAISALVAVMTGVFVYSVLPTPLKTRAAALLQGDINGDGKVDIFDLSILLSNFGKSVNPTPTPATTPTPIGTGGGSTTMAIGVNEPDWGMNPIANAGTLTVQADTKNLVSNIRWDADALSWTDLANNDIPLGLHADIDFAGPYDGSGLPHMLGCDSTGHSCNGIASWVANAIRGFKTACNSSSLNCPWLEVLNEPTGPWYYGSTSDSRPAADAYAQLVEATDGALHAQFGAGSPKVLAWAVGGGCANGHPITCTDPWADYIRRDYPDFGSYYDGVLIHPYGGDSCSLVCSAAGNQSAVTSAHLQTGKPVDITEVGWATDSSRSISGDDEWTEQQQANNIYNFINWARRTNYVDGIWYYNFFDDAAPSWYGLSRSNEGGSTTNSSHKPGWTALQEAAHLQPCTAC